MHQVPARAFIAGDVFRAEDGVIAIVGRICGRGRNRQAHVATFEKGERSVAWRKVARLRRVLERNNAAPFDGPVCRVCGCVDDNCQACIDLTDEPCSWIEADLCSACHDERRTSAFEDGVVSRIAGDGIDKNPWPFCDDFPNDLREEWRKGWLEEDARQTGKADKIAVGRRAARDERRRQLEERAVARKNQRALDSLQAFTGAARRAGFIRRG